MNNQEFIKLSDDLQKLALLIPLNWGNVQNDTLDSMINMFQLHSFEDLESQICKLSVDVKNYYRRRWFLWKCAQCDEYIFSKNNNVTINPNKKDQEFDIEFNGNNQLRFDIKGTVIPNKYRPYIPAIIDDPSEIVNFYYEKQSTGVRNKIQNRLFIIHHSFCNQERERYVRCLWDYKMQVFKEYSEQISLNSNFIYFQDVKADVIFIFENLDRTISHWLYAVK